MRHHTIRVLAPVCILLSLIIGFGAYTVSRLDKSAKDLGSHIDQIEAGIRSEHWEDTVRELDYVQEHWEKIGKAWATLLDHIEIDNIDDTLTRLSGHIEARDKSMALAESGALKQFILHIPKKESFRMENLF